MYFILSNFLKIKVLVISFDQEDLNLKSVSGAILDFALF